MRSSFACHACHHFGLGLADRGALHITMVGQNAAKCCKSSFLPEQGCEPFIQEEGRAEQIANMTTPLRTFFHSACLRVTFSACTGTLSSWNHDCSAKRYRIHSIRLTPDSRLTVLRCFAQHSLTAE